MKKVYIGQDNGVTSTIGILQDDEVAQFIPTPVFRSQDYTKAKKSITRLNVEEYYAILSKYSDRTKYQTLLLLERPLVNPTRFNATASALRCHEAMLVCIELLQIPYRFIDSKEWQKYFFPKGVGAENTKKMSLEIGNRYFPEYKNEKHPDRDGLLIALYAKYNNL